MLFSQAEVCLVGKGKGVSHEKGRRAHTALLPFSDHIHACFPVVFSAPRSLVACLGNPANNGSVRPDAPEATLQPQPVPAGAEHAEYILVEFYRNYSLGGEISKSQKDALLCLEVAGEL